MAVSGLLAYHSNDIISQDIAFQYDKATKEAPHRFLANRDIPKLLEQNAPSKDLKRLKAIDIGSGTGISTDFLHKLGLNVIGVDISPEMLEQAKNTHPELEFRLSRNGLIPSISKTYDVAFSSFVLLEMSSPEKIVQYLNEAKRVLKKGGFLIAITASEQMFSERDWLVFNTNYPENTNLTSGSPTKILLNGTNLEFTDYFWKETDYLKCFQEAGLDVVDIQYPKGQDYEPYLWKHEKVESPFVIFVAKRN